MKIFPNLNKTKVNPNTQEFYKKHPDLAPRNVYLYEGRVLDLKTVKNYLKNEVAKESIFDRIGNWFSNLINKTK